MLTLNRPLHTATFPLCMHCWGIGPVCMVGCRPLLDTSECYITKKKQLMGWEYNRSPSRVCVCVCASFSMGVTTGPLQCKCTGKLEPHTTSRLDGRHVLYIGSSVTPIPSHSTWRQMTLRALYLLHNALVQYQGRIRRNGWFSGW